MYGILMIADEVMSGFGRTGEWFAVDHWHVVPDLLTMAKGLHPERLRATGARASRRHISRSSEKNVFLRRLLTNSHPLASRRPGYHRGVDEQRDKAPHSKAACLKRAAWGC